MVTRKEDTANDDVHGHCMAGTELINLTLDAEAKESSPNTIWFHSLRE
jgi:hypothetical protein